MSKSTHFFGQPIYGQFTKFLNKDKILQISRNHGRERYVKSFDGFTHLLTMLYAVIMRFDSLREIETSMIAEVRKLHHIGIETVPKRSTLSDANTRRPERVFEEVYRDLYEANKSKLTSDSRQGGTEEWMKRPRIIDSTAMLDADKIIGDTLILGLGKADEIYEGIGRGLLNIENLPVYRDSEGGIATPTSDSVRTMISPETKRILLIINCYDGNQSALEDVLNYSRKGLTNFANALESTKCWTFN